MFPQTSQGSEDTKLFFAKAAVSHEFLLYIRCRHAILWETKTLCTNEITTPAHAAFLDFEAVRERWFYKPDHQAMRIVLGTLQAHYLHAGDPTWLFIVAPPGTGKTTMNIMSAAALPEIVQLSDFTENTFLSGFYSSPQPGMLEKLGRTTQEGKTYTTHGDAIFLVKDFTSVLTMRREKRGVILAQLREIHDGLFKRDFGTGESKIWQGRVSVVAAVTPALDRHYSIFSTLGERFLQVRSHRPDSSVAGKWAIRQQGHEVEIRAQLQAAMARLFGDLPHATPTLSAECESQIVALAELTAIARTHVYRSAYGKREIEYVPESEANTRISKGLAAIAKGIASLNRRSEVAPQDVNDALRVGLDCIPDYRRRLLDAVIRGQSLDLVPIPRTVRNRELEELYELTLIEMGGLDDPVGWKLTDKANELLEATGLLAGFRSSVPMCSG